MKETGDLGLMDEPALLERMRPGGKFAITAAPKLTSTSGLIAATCETPGSSIAYTTNGKHWLLYTKPVTAAPSLRFKACRLGYKDSPEVKA